MSPTGLGTFEISSPGKWILVGEHSVLRGAPALVFPLMSRTMTLKYESGAEPLKVVMQGAHGPELDSLFWAVLERACDLLRIPRSQIRGNLILTSNLPLGAGLGASAAFCVNMSQWFVYLGFLGTSEVKDFARTLENLFHGESSGVDIAVAISKQGLHFVRGENPFVLVPAWTPKLYISYSGQKGMTSDAVKKVKTFIESEPQKGKALDSQMREAVLLCERALASSAGESLFALQSGLSLAAQCFEYWGLSSGAVKEHINRLLESGAMVAKPTGSGGGGYVLSLWQEAPPAVLADVLIECFAPVTDTADRGHSTV